jgi:hypothetical protein
MVDQVDIGQIHTGDIVSVEDERVTVGGSTGVTSGG